MHFHDTIFWEHIIQSGEQVISPLDSDLRTNAIHPLQLVYIFFFYLFLEEISFQKIDIHTSHYYQSCVSMHTNFSTYILSILQTFTICASKRFLSIVLTGLCNSNTIILPSAWNIHGLFNLLSFSLYVLWVNPRQHAGYSLVYIYSCSSTQYTMGLVQILSFRAIVIAYILY